MGIIMLATVEWKPKFEFSFARGKGLLGFGSKWFGAVLLNSLYENLQNLVVGKHFSPATLAFYNRGISFPNLIVNNINASIQAVMFPAFSNLQDEKAELINKMRKSIRVPSFAMMPLMAILAAIAEPLVLILLGEKWLPCVPFLQVYCFIYALYPIHTSNLACINALGKSGIVLVQQIFKLALSLLVLLICVFLLNSVVSLALGFAFLSLVSVFLNSHPNQKLIGYGFVSQIRDVLPIALLSAFAGFLAFLISLLGLNLYITILLQICIGFGAYYSLSKIFHMEALEEIFETIQHRRKTANA
jgi:O-antigen/teichoic acid export membrane protein